MVVVVVAPLLLPAAPTAATAEASGPAVAPSVLGQIDTSGSADFWVELGATADLSGARNISDWGERGRYVVKQLRAAAKHSQAEVLNALKSAGADHEAFWASNRILVRGGTKAALDAVTARAGVQAVEARRVYDLSVPEARPASTGSGAVEWGVAHINADKVWATFGVRGEGIVVGSIDTGVDHTHPALVDRYRGTRPDGTFDHAYNWFDPQGDCASNEPCDDWTHGTHTTGTIVGDGGPGNRIGVAPGAKWIAAKGCRVFTCSDEALLAAGQWMLAPTDAKGANADPARRPHVVNNSWANTDGGDTWYRDVVSAWVAAGIFPTFAAGNNDRFTCGSISAPASYSESYAIGPHDRHNRISTGSYGPSPVDGSTKPDALAPGFDIRSAAAGGSYTVMGGSSIAVPHASGAVALLLSAQPSLIGNVTAVRRVLDTAAVDLPDIAECGGDAGDNNTTGEGRLDALAAVRAVAVDVATVSGTVTDAVTGAPIGGVAITAPGVTPASPVTGADGMYHLFAPSGDHELRYEAYGYEPASVTVTAAAGQASTSDVRLHPLARATLAGTVTDGSGHGWGLYARVDIEGHPQSPIFTDPATGGYAVDVVSDVPHALTVTPVAEGYLPEVRTVTVGPGGSTSDFALAADVACTAPGYRFRGLLRETFDEPRIPDGWVVSDGGVFSEGWRFDDPGARGNHTGGQGGFAIIDSDWQGFGFHQDTTLASPVIDLSTAAKPYLRFNHDLVASSDEVFGVDVSLAGTWTRLWRREASEGSLRGPRIDEIDLSIAAGHPEVRVRFLYYNASYEWWWAVDNVVIADRADVSGCEVVAGGLVVGNVTDALSGKPLPGAVVRLDATPATSGTAKPTPRRGSHPAEAHYTLFSPVTGPRSFTTTVDRYPLVQRTVDVIGDTAVRADVAVGSGRLVVDSEVTKDVVLGDRAEATFTLRNDGSEPVRYELLERDHGGHVAGLTPTAEPAAASFVRSDLPRPWRTMQPGPGAPATHPASEPSGEPPWVKVAPYPTRIAYNATATHDGKVYSVGGWNYAGPKKDLFVYDPDSDAWTRGPDMPEVRLWPSAAFLGGRLYVYGGWDDVGQTLRSIDVYDPATSTWTRGANAPVGRAGAGFAAVAGHLYVVGGCADAFCRTDARVVRYDPAADAWTSAASYPKRIAGAACGGIDGGLYCAGGIEVADWPEVETDAAYAYQPDTNTWSTIAPLAWPRWAAAHSVANGQLVLVGGASGGWVFDSVVAYDPTVDEWTDRAPSGTAAALGAGACGFYRVGGVVGFGLLTRDAERFRSLNRCGPTDIPWLSVAPSGATIAPGEVVTVRTVVDASAVDQPGTYTGAIAVREDTPHDVRPVQVTLNAVPPATWGRIEGTVLGGARCDGPGAPLPRARVTISGPQRDLVVQPVSDGRYVGWMESGGPISVTAQASGWLPARRDELSVVPGGATAFDATLRRDQPCASTSTERLDLRIHRGESAVAEIGLANTGAAPYTVRVHETPFALDPVAYRPATGAPAPDAAPTVASSSWSSSSPETTETPVPSWFRGADLPGGLVNFGYAQCDGDPNQAYAVGGVAGGGRVSDSTWRYDATTNTWAELAPMPEGNAGIALACDAGRLHAIGGTRLPVGTTTAHYVYDIGTDIWTTAAPAPRRVQGAAAGAWNGRVFLAGGSTAMVGGRATGQVDVYDVATDGWTTLPAPMATTASDVGSVQVGPYLYVTGGWNHSSPSLQVAQRLDMRTETWTTGPPLTVGRRENGLVATAGALYSMGGREFRGGYQMTDTVERLDLSAWPGGGWTAFDPLPFKLDANGAYCTEAVTGGEIWSAGGGIFEGWGRLKRTWFHGVAPERCPTIRSDVPWLATPTHSVTVVSDGHSAIDITIDTSTLPIGTHTATLLLTTTDRGLTEVRIPVRITVVPPPPIVYIGLDGDLTIGELAVAEEDIVGVNRDGLVTPFFDGSDVGLSAAAIDAFAQLADGSLVLSFGSSGAVPGVSGEVDDSDLVRFVPTSLGSDTAGRFELWFDGSDVALTSDDEDVDGVEVLDDARVIISTVGTAKVQTAKTEGAEMLIFSPTQLGETTSGSFDVFFDGRDVDLATSDEDIDAVAAGNDGSIALSTTGPAAAPQVTAANEDAFVFRPTELGKHTRGAFDSRLLFDGSLLALGSSDLTVLELPRPTEAR